MAKLETMFVCSDCGEEATKWQGKCPVCDAWNTLREVRLPPRSAISSTRHQQGTVVAQPANAISAVGGKRLATNLVELDRVLGGGFVEGSVILIAGNPGIGKSTLLLSIAEAFQKSKVLYISGEESPAQIKMRIERVAPQLGSLLIYPETTLPAIEATILKEKPQFVLVDSIQTLFDPSYPSTPGSLVQVRECAMRLFNLAKAENFVLILVGHLTKDGTVAGPRTLEHMVDVVLYLDGERYQNGRFLSSTKNRFGPTDELGIFEMENGGIRSALNPGENFLGMAGRKFVAGSVVTSVLVGIRPLLAEIQALVVPSFYSTPRHSVVGLDSNRVELILAILERRAGLRLAGRDIFVNVVGGLKIKEPGADLAVALAVASAAKDLPVKDGYCVFGELGLTGEIRPVSLLKRRRGEAERLGFKQFIQSTEIKAALGETLRTLK